MGTHFLPALYQQIKLEILEDNDRDAAIQDALQVGMINHALRHKKAIQAEMQRREDNENAKRRRAEEAARAKARRQERRRCLKEQLRLNQLQEVLTTQAMPAAEQREYTVSLPIYDIRDYSTDVAPGIYTFGGFIGELMITLQALQEYMMTKADNPAPFEIKAEGILRFLEEIIDGYPAGLCVLRLTADPLPEEDKGEEIAIQAEGAAKRLM